MRITYYHGSPKDFWGRFGGGWNWKLGFQLGYGTLIISLLVFDIRVNF